MAAAVGDVSKEYNRLGVYCSDMREIIATPNYHQDAEQLASLVTTFGTAFKVVTKLWGARSVNDLAIAALFEEMKKHQAIFTSDGLVKNPRNVSQEVESVCAKITALKEPQQKQAVAVTTAAAAAGVGTAVALTGPGAAAAGAADGGALVPLAHAGHLTIFPVGVAENQLALIQRQSNEMVEVFQMIGVNPGTISQFHAMPIENRPNIVTLLILDLNKTIQEGVEAIHAPTLMASNQIDAIASWTKAFDLLLDSVVKSKKASNPLKISEEVSSASKGLPGPQNVALLTDGGQQSEKPVSADAAGSGAAAVAPAFFPTNFPSFGGDFAIGFAGFAPVEDASVKLQRFLTEQKALIAKASKDTLIILGMINQLSSLEECEAVLTAEECVAKRNVIMLYQERLKLFGALEKVFLEHKMLLELFRQQVEKSAGVQISSK